MSMCHAVCVYKYIYNWSSWLFKSSTSRDVYDQFPKPRLAIEPLLTCSVGSAEREGGVQ